MSKVYKSCIHCGYLYDYNGYAICPECGKVPVDVKEKDEDDSVEEKNI